MAIQISGGVQLSGPVLLDPTGGSSSSPSPSGGFQGTNHGYTSGGVIQPPYTVANTIDKFPFASDGNATDVGDITQKRQYLVGQSSTESGYASGGAIATNPLTLYTTIDKFPFASDTNATAIGNLTQGRQEPAGQSSTASGYTSGGYTSSSSNVIDKFSFASDANATDVGNLSVARRQVVGQQY